MSEHFYREIYRIRRIEETIAEIYPTDKIKSPIHLSIGQEAVAVGICAALQKSDVIFGTHRSHAAYLAKGGNLNRMMAELYGKAAGCSKGKGGSMHLVDMEAGVMGTSSIVGTSIPHAVGYAYALKLQKAPRIAVDMFGDGAVEEGVFHESLNFAALKKLPVIFICENNQYSVHARLEDRHSKNNLVEKARAYGIAAQKLDGNKPDEIKNAIAAARQQILDRDNGPFFFEITTYRWKEHVGPGNDFHAGYRSLEEWQEWKKKDPLEVLGPALNVSTKEKIRVEIEKEIKEAICFAEDSPWPDDSKLYEDLFAESRDGSLNEAVLRTVPDSGRILSYAEAVHEATFQAMESDPSVFVYGIDVADFKGTYGTTLGLVNRFGQERVFSTPVSEDSMTGLAIGAALAGMKPIHIHIRMDFLMLAMNQLINLAAKMYSMHGAAAPIPIVIRAVIGKSWGQGAQHSQGLHALLAHIPGIKVIAPTTPFDAKGCLLQALQDPNPVLMVEHRLLHFQKGPVPEEMYSVSFGKARILRAGKDITLVGVSWMAVECLRAAELLSKQGIEAEVIDPVTLSPLDIDTISMSAQKTRKLLAVDAAWTFCGMTAEILAQVSERNESSSPLQLKRMGHAPMNCAPAPNLEALFYPDASKIAQAVLEMINPGTSQRIPEKLSSEAVPF